MSTILLESVVLVLLNRNCVKFLYQTFSFGLRGNGTKRKMESSSPAIPGNVKIKSFLIGNKLATRVLGLLSFASKAQGNNNSEV